MAHGPPAKGGIATYALSLLADPTLRTRFRMEFQNTEQVEGTGGRLNWRNLMRAVRDARRTYQLARGADIVHPQTALWPGFVALRTAGICAAARLGGASVVTHVHSGRVVIWSDPAHRASWTYRIGCRLVARFSDRVLTVADATTDALSRRYMPGTSVETVDNAVDVREIATSTLDGDPPVIVYVGGLTFRKGLLDLFDALRELRRRGIVEWKLRIIGGVSEAGEVEAASIERAAGEAELSGSFEGALDREEVQRQLSQADLFVLPSHMEAQPLAILEAMAAGLPVVSTDVAQIPLMVRDGADGFIVPPNDPASLADALDTLLRDADLRRRFGSSARARTAERYDRRVLSERLADVYESLLRNGR